MSLDLPELTVVDEEEAEESEEERVKEEEIDEGEPQLTWAESEAPETNQNITLGMSEDENEDRKDGGRDEVDVRSPAVDVEPDSNLGGKDKDDGDKSDSMDVDEPEEAPSVVDDNVEEDRASETEAHADKSHSPSPAGPSRKRKRLDSPLAEDEEMASPTSEIDEHESKSPSLEAAKRQTRLRSSRKTETPPAPVVTDEDDEPDELDIISVASDKKAQNQASRVASANPSSEDEEGQQELAEKQEEAVTVSPEALETQKEGKVSEIEKEVEVSQVVPATPSTPSQSTSQEALQQSNAKETDSSAIRALPSLKSTDATPLSPRPSPAPPIVVKLKLPPPTPQPTYSFLPAAASAKPNDLNIKQENEDSARKVPSHAASRFGFAKFKKDMNLSLPPLSALPSEFNRKGKPQRRKRDKERSEVMKRDDWTPFGMAKWSALLRINPVYPKLSRASKCLSTRDWTVRIL